jgi:class 3 adenylate cyclase
MEEIGSEVGLAPPFIREALARLTTAPAERSPRRRSMHGPGDSAAARAWWASAWAIPLIFGALLSQVHMPGSQDVLVAPFVIGGWALYGGVGAFLTHRAREQWFQQAQGGVAEPLGRRELLDLLFTLQRELQSQEQHRAFLSVDVVGSSEMKRGAAPLAVEYSFGQFRSRVEEIVAVQGGQVHSAAGDGLMAMLPDAASALKAAAALHAMVPAFNREQNHLPTPFRIRCGISAGKVALAPGAPIGQLYSAVLDHAAALQKRAQPGGTLVSREVAEAAPGMLGAVTDAEEEVGGEPAFDWQPSAAPSQPATLRSR